MILIGDIKIGIYYCKTSGDFSAYLVMENTLHKQYRKNEGAATNEWCMKKSHGEYNYFTNFWN